MPRAPVPLPAFWQDVGEGKFLCTYCEQYYGESEAPITQKATKRHSESPRHNDALENIHRPRIASPLSPDNNDQPSYVSLLQAELHLNGRNLSPQAAHNISDIIENFVFNDVNDGYGHDPLSLLDDSDSDEADNTDDSPTSWDDERYLMELGFGESFNRDQEEDDTLTNVMQQLANQTLEDGLLGSAGAGAYNPQWFPYPNKTTLVLDAIDNLPRLPISDSLMRIIIWILEETGAEDVPSFHAFRKLQKKLRAQSNISTRKFESVLGNIFYMNDLGSLLAKDFANPLVRPHLRFYPEEPDGLIAEVWHGEKWRNFPPEYLTPMYIDPATGYHFYVNEYAQTKDGLFYVPIRWIIRKGTLCADAHLGTLLPDNTLISNYDATVNVPASEFMYNILSLLEMGLVSLDTPEVRERIMPNPLRALAGGEPLYSIFIDEWNDDVSGNRSKSYNKHFNTYITNRNLPRKLLQQEYHVHFLGTSQFATVTEQNEAVKNMIIESHHTPVQAYDCTTRSSCRFRIFKSAAPADNPMQSDICSHIGSGGLKKCRRCDAGGNAQHVESSAGYQSLFKAGVSRSANGTYAELKEQLRLSTLGVRKPISDRQTDTGVKDKVTQIFIDQIINKARADLKDDNGVAIPADDKTNALNVWILENENRILNPSMDFPGFDPHVDTPMELLHTISLGIAKYAWHSSHTPWKVDAQITFSHRLQAANVDGLSLPPIRAAYIMQYANSLIGRQLKTLVQLAVFQLHDLVSYDHLLLWRAVGELAALLWYLEIDNLESYIEDIDVCVDNVLDQFSILQPSRITTKLKLHLLVHAAADIRRFGPLIGESTEIYECYNAIFRSCSIYSNKLAPSRDIAIQFAELEGAKQRISGGYWRDDDGKWIRSGSEAQLFFATASVLQNHLGWITDSRDNPGEVHSTAKQRQKKNVAKFNSLKASHAVNKQDFAQCAEWIKATSVTTLAGDTAKDGSWVFATSPITEKLMIGRVLEILECDECPVACVTLSEFELAMDRHSKLGMPVLCQPHGEEKIVLVHTKAIKFIVNVQHDCIAASCAASGKRRVVQEREETANFEAQIQHESMEQFIINLHAFHNSHLLRRAIPRQLWAPERFIALSERAERHSALAAKLHKTQTAKRASAKEKRAQKAKEKVQQAEANKHADQTELDGTEDPNVQADDVEPPTDNEDDEQMQMLNEITAARVQKDLTLSVAKKARKKPTTARKRKRAVAD